MKKMFAVVCLLTVTASISFAANFAPALLEISAPEIVQYDFDGTPLEIPTKITGGMASGTVFLVYTKDMADIIPAVRNGFLGWHYVNKVDTCIYFSSQMNFDAGDNVVVWDGNDNDGQMVTSGEYTYYLWGFDYSNIRQKVNATLLFEGGSGGSKCTVLEYGEDGMPLKNPIFIGKNFKEKWTVGNDPDDETLMETTTYALKSGWSASGGQAIAFQPGDYRYWFMEVGNRDIHTMAVVKLHWVPNGESVIATEWADDGYSTFDGHRDVDPGVETDGDYLYTLNNEYHFVEAAVGEFYTMEIEDGTIIREIDITDWWSNAADLEAGAQLNGGPNGMMERNGYIFLSCHCSCMKQMVNPKADDDEFVVWTNTNGDYVWDRNFEEDSDRPWVCFDFNASLQGYGFNADSYNFTVGAPNAIAVTFGLLGPDGTGVGYFAGAGETPCHKFLTRVVDNGGAYDGLYVDFNSSGNVDENRDKEKYIKGLWYLAQDSFRGILTSKPVKVKEDEPASFDVLQNSPNPFNPTTTISFIIPEAGNLTIDVFNVAGQKVDTIVSDFMDAGIHSVTWDASGFSAGVYFYTVKSGDFSRTMKMTLLK